MRPERDGAERLPPHSREAERSVLGSMLRDNGVIDDVLLLVRPDQHVAWRGDAVPDNPLGLIDRVRGA